MLVTETMNKMMDFAEGGAAPPNQEEYGGVIGGE
jgi:hypothetical protein